MKRVAIRRKRHADPVTKAVHDLVIDRDLKFAGGCLAAFLDSDHGCRTLWGDPQRPDVMLTLDHVQEGYGRLGRRAPSDPAHLVSVCAGAHIVTSWVTSHKALLREYIARAERERAA